MLRKRMILGELEMKVLSVLWERGPGTVAEVVEALPDDEERHYNTVATVLRRLHAKGIVRRAREGRSYVFTPEVSREDLAREYLDIVKRELYGGSWADLVAALVTPGRKPGKAERKVARLLEELTAEEKEDEDER